MALARSDPCSVLIYKDMCIHIYILKTLRVTAVSKGDGMMFEQGGNQGIGRNHQDLSGNARFTRLGGFQRPSWWAPWGSSGTSEIHGGVNSH